MSTTMIHGPVEVSIRNSNTRFYIDDPLKAVEVAVKLFNPDRLFTYNRELKDQGTLEYWPNKEPADWHSLTMVFGIHEIYSLLEQGLDIQLCDDKANTVIEISLPRPEIWVYTITLVHPAVDLPYEIIDGEHLALVRVTKWTWIVTTKADLSKALENYQYWRRPLL